MVCAFALLPLLGAEVLLRLFEVSVSADAAQIGEIDQKFESLRKSHAENRMLVLGNSLAGEGIDAQELRANVDQNMEIAKVTPDATNIWDWSCLIDTATDDHSRIPTYIVVGFATDQISDQAPIDVHRTFGNFCGPGRIGELYSEYRLNSEDVFQALAVKASVIYRYRAKIRNNLLNFLVPEYLSVTQRINTSESPRHDRITTPDNLHRPAFSYNQITNIAGDPRFRSSIFILVAMPTKSGYALDRGVCGLQGLGNIVVIDGRQFIGHNPELFRDRMHLNATGQQIFTSALSQAIKNASILQNKADSIDTLCIRPEGAI